MIVLSRKARENIELQYALPEMRCDYIAVIESKQLDGGGDVIASSGSDLVGRVSREWTLLSIEKLD